MNLKTFGSASIVAAEAADAFIRFANECIERRGVFRVALAGGSTPKKMYEMLREATIDWGKVEFFFSDERFVLPSNEQSNELMARLALLNHIRPRAIFGMVTADSASVCAANYCGVLPKDGLDLVLLGLGTDGHTASLFPGEPSVFEKERAAIPAKAPVNAPERITMSPPYVLSARQVWFIVTGADKAEPARRMIDGPEDWSITPSQAIARHGNHVTIFGDRAALEG